MKKNTLKNLSASGVILSFLVLFVSWNSAWGSPFQNGDFETGDFTGWSGDLVNTGLVDPNTDPHFHLFNTPDPQFDVVANVQNDDLEWSATLFQDFTLDTLNGPGWTMDITFWIGWSPTDSILDSISAQIQDTAYTDTVDLVGLIPTNDLLNGTWVTQDITSFAQTWGGQDVELSFTISDGDFFTPDSFTVDNISINQHAPAPVPEPATMLLLGSGLGGFALSRRKKLNK